MNLVFWDGTSQNDNFWCTEWRKFCRKDYISFSVLISFWYGETIEHSKIVVTAIELHIQSRSGKYDISWESNFVFVDNHYRNSLTVKNMKWQLICPCRVVVEKYDITFFCWQSLQKFKRTLAVEEWIYDEDFSAALLVCVENALILAIDLHINVIRGRSG